MASLKGPRHGGANSKVMAMMDDVKEHVRDWNDEGCVADYLTRILNKDAFDRSGLIYGLGEEETADAFVSGAADLLGKGEGF